MTRFFYGMVLDGGGSLRKIVLLETRKQVPKKSPLRKLVLRRGRDANVTCNKNELVEVKIIMYIEVPDNTYIALQNFVWTCMLKVFKRWWACRVLLATSKRERFVKRRSVATRCSSILAYYIDWVSDARQNEAIVRDKSENQESGTVLYNQVGRSPVQSLIKNLLNIMKVGKKFGGYVWIAYLLWELDWNMKLYPW